MVEKSKEPEDLEAFNVRQSGATERDGEGLRDQ